MFEIWFGWYDLRSLLFKCLGNLFENLENPLWSSSLICQSPTKAIWWYFLKTIYTYAACFCIELCQIVVTLERILFMHSWSRFTCIPYTPLLYFFKKLALYHPLIPQNKCSTRREERHGLSKKNIWTHEGPSKKERKKKCGHMKVHEKKKKKIAMLSREFI